MFLKSSATFSFFTFISRIFGFVRDILIATYFGTGMFADAFNVAFKLPNFFRNIFAEGAFSAAFVPLFTGKLYSKNKKEALKFASNILTILTLVLLAIIFLFEIFMPFVIMGLAPGFKANSYKLNLTIYLTRVTTPYLCFISLVTFYACILNSIDKFASMAFAPVILNLTMILSLHYFGNNEEEKVVTVAWAVFIGGLLQLVFILIPIAKKNMWINFAKPRLNADTSKFFKNIAPASMGSGITQLNLWIGTIIATAIPGAVSMIYYVERIVQLPISLIGVSIGIVILPKLSRCFKSENREKAIYIQNRALEIALLLSLPCAAALFALSEPLIYVLFERGAFKQADTVSTAPALMTLAIGIPAYVMNKIMIPSFFAVEDTKTPVKISIVCLIVNVVSNLILIQYLAHVGITLATAVTAWVNVILLYIFSYKKNIFVFDHVIKLKTLKILLSCMFLYLFLKASVSLCRQYIFCKSIYSPLVFMFIIVSGGILYLYSLHATRAYTLKDLKEVT